MSKEQIIRNYAHDYRYMEMGESSLELMLTNCADEIIEKLIEEIQLKQGKALLRRAANEQAYVGAEYASCIRHTEEELEEIKQQLRAKWLGNKN